MQAGSRGRHAIFIAAAGLIVSLALAGRALAKCATFSVELHPITAADLADTCVAIPCRVSLSLDRNGTLWDIAVLDPDGRLRMIDLREVDQ